MTARALLWTGGSSFEVADLPVPEPGPGELLVRVTTAAICGSDRRTVSGLRGSPCPGILGHEGVGTILTIGGGGSGVGVGDSDEDSAPPEAIDIRGQSLAPGDRIVWSVVSACGECGRCRSGHTAKCHTLRKAGHEGIGGTWPLSGSYSTHVLLPAGHEVVRLDPGVSDAAGAVSACAGATVMAVLDAAPSADLTGHRVLINGLGMLGLLAILACRAAGASDIHVVDPAAARRDLALRAGARAASAPGEGPTGPVDLALELSGAAGGVASVIDSLDVGGAAVLAGSVAPGPAVPLDPEHLVRGRRSIIGVHNYEPRHLAAAVELLGADAAAVLSDPEVLSAPIGLDAVPAAFAAEPEHLRTIIAP